MDSKNSQPFPLLIRVFVLLNFLVCPFVFIGMVFVPQMINFLEPIVCPDGFQMETVTEMKEDDEGDMVRSATLHCVNGRENVDVSWKGILIMLGFPALGVLILFLVPTPR